MKNKVWVDASEWLEEYNENQLQQWYKDKKKYERKANNTKLNNKQNIITSKLPKKNER